ncbi:MAG: hypothetical protein ACXWLH_04680 [Candidatus Saccharimonadales bacterium]
MAKIFKNSLGSKRLAIFVFAFAIVGSLYLIITHAASPNTKTEPETGSINAPAQSGTDGSASGGGYVQFGGIGKSRLGVDLNDLPPGISLAQAYDVMAFLGFGWVRTTVGVSDYSNLNPSNFDYELSQAKRTNIKVMVVITYAYNDCSGGKCAPNDPGAWAHYAGQLVAHWKAAYPGVVDAVEVWNEANNPFFWNPVDPVAYTDLLKRTYLEIKAADPKVIVVASGTAPGSGNKSADSTSNPNNPATFYKQIYAAGAKGYFDVAANHPYDTSSSTANQTSSGLRNTFWIRKVMVSNGEQAKQIWSTEAGLVSCLNGPNPADAPMTEAERGQRLKDDLNDFWHGIHDPNDGHTIGQSAIGDWNAGPYFIFKLYKSTSGDPGLGIIYNTNAVMQTTPSSVASREPLCKTSPDFFVPVAGPGNTPDYMAQVIAKFSGAPLSKIVN